MKKYMKFLNALLFLGSLTCVFMSMIKIGVWKLSGAEILKIGFQDIDEDNLLHMVLAYAQEYMEKMILLMIAVIVIAIVGAVLSVVLRGNAAYAAGTVFAVIDIVCVFSIYIGLNSNISDIKRALSFFGKEGAVKLYHCTFVLWLFLYAAVIVFSLLSILSGNKKKAAVKGDIYTEQFNNRRNTLQQQKSVDMRQRPQQPAAQNRVAQQRPQQPAAQNRVAQQRPQQPAAQNRVVQQRPQQPAAQNRVVQQRPQPVVDMVKVPVQGFSGAIVGKDGLYAGKAYPLKEKYEVFFVQQQGTVNVSEYIEENALAGVYYISEYQEYCVDVKQKNTVYLVSGQPLGAGREYYLPRGMEIYILNKKNLFKLA